MESAPRATPLERRRAAEDAFRRGRFLSVAIGALGLVLLFAGAIASLLFPLTAYVTFIVLELIGIALIVVSFIRLRRLRPPLPRSSIR